jgi:hypothetical protein
VIHLSQDVYCDGCPDSPDRVGDRAGHGDRDWIAPSPE